MQRLFNWLVRDDLKQGFDMSRLRYKAPSADQIKRRRAAQLRGKRQLAAAQRWQKGSS